MWVAMNDSFVSIVQDRTNEDRVVVRARVKEDLEATFPFHSDDIIETTNSDYRFRLFLDKYYVSKIMQERVLGIDYPNFKDSVKQPWRKKAYMDIWQTMFNVQADTYGAIKWWLNYR